jgi:hypothetical protein
MGRRRIDQRSEDSRPQSEAGCDCVALSGSVRR